MALVWLAPAWFFVDSKKVAATAIGTGFWFGMLPDVDLVLQRLPGIHHHGVFHTVLFVTLLALVIGPIVGWLLTKLLGDSEWFVRDSKLGAKIGLIVVWVAGIAHLFADMLSAPDVSTRIEPLWPLVDGPIVMMDVLWYKSFWATTALFILGVAANLIAWYLADGRRSSTATA
ncbi:metal-dependent hydrolase [Halogeometricum limi]|nr:metal-dependent hydrolase [Halogeometricum limi]